MALERQDALARELEQELMRKAIDGLDYGRRMTMRRFDMKTMHHADFQHVDLGYSSFKQTQLQHANFEYANLGSCDLSQAIMTSANLNHVRACCANFESALLYKANAAYSNFRFANLNNANLFAANFQFADLSHASLINANFSKADFTNATLTGTRFVNDALFAHDVVDVKQILSELDWLKVSVEGHKNKNELIKAIAADIQNNLKLLPESQLKTQLVAAVHAHPLMQAVLVPNAKSSSFFGFFYTLSGQQNNPMEELGDQFGPGYFLLS